MLRALSRITGEQMAMYPGNNQVATERLARFFRVCVPTNCSLSNGVDDALHLITDTFVEKGDTVLVPEPTFDMYRFYSELAGARVISVRYDARNVISRLRVSCANSRARPARALHRESKQSDRYAARPGRAPPNPARQPSNAGAGG